MPSRASPITDLLPRVPWEFESHRREIVALAVVITSLILLADLVIPLGVTIWTLYLIPFLMLALAAPHRLGGALVAYVALIAIGLVLSPPGALDLGLVLVNWGIFTVSFLLVAGLLVLIRQQHEQMVAEIEQRRRTGEALRTANRRLQLLSSITRHDINNQLTGLNGHVGLLQMDAADPELERRVQAIMDASDRVSSLIRFTAEYETIGIETPVWHDLVALVCAAASEIPSGRVRLRNEIPRGAEIYADGMAGRVFSNLIDNAVRHGGTITTIRFSVHDAGDATTILCEDDGDGIPDGKKERIFDRGFGENTGFGLFLSREILAITGIAIRETGTPGHGARFEMAIPAGGYRVAPSMDAGPGSGTATADAPVAEGYRGP